ncbi:hypothetical protein H9X83_03895 [Anaerotignum lactatifermentans]|uniref:Uncharacterized protein n=1 Tax=Anaerotignum lactatifermentans TaxID=160404 RepID=A0ABS2G9I9_9FIRM|nr:hypothetical protein [Anaerotignum lactatifermentans]
MRKTADIEPKETAAKEQKAVRYRKNRKAEIFVIKISAFFVLSERRLKKRLSLGIV